MATPILGQLKAFPYTFEPKGWALCDGRVIPFAQYTGLFSLIGTTYGGNGTSTFALPDLRGRTPIGWGQGPGMHEPYQLGQFGGSPEIDLDSENVPPHTHSLNVSTGTKLVTDAAGSYVGAAAIYVPAADDPSPNCPLNNKTILEAGASEPISLMQPYLVMNWFIAVEGTFPQRS